MYELYKYIFISLREAWPLKLCPCTNVSQQSVLFKFKFYHTTMVEKLYGYI